MSLDICKNKEGKTKDDKLEFSLEHSTLPSKNREGSFKLLSAVSACILMSYAGVILHSPF